MSDTIGQRIRAVRLSKGWSQTDFGQVLGVSAPAVSDIERDKTKVDFARLGVIAQALGVEPQALAYGDPVTPPAPPAWRFSAYGDLRRGFMADGFTRKEALQLIRELIRVPRAAPPDKESTA